MRNGLRSHPVHFRVYKVQKQAALMYGERSQKGVASWRAGSWGIDWKEVGGNFSG